jgi:hypothetical protein
MRKVIYTVKSFGGFHMCERTSFAEAVERAGEFARQGSLPAVITDSHGCRWTVGEYPGARPYLAECPAIDSGLARECGCGAEPD